jgi:Na+/melibiose symporter-like transporter
MIFCVTGAVARAKARPSATSEIHASSALLDLARNARLVRILAVCVLSAGLVTVFMRGTLFYASAALGDASSAMYLVAAQMGGQLLGLPIWQHIAAKTQKTTAAIAAQLLLAASMAAFYVAAPNTLASAWPLYCAMGAAVGGLTVMNWAIVPDTVEYTEAACGRRHEGLTFGSLLFLNKAASGFALALLGWVLAMIGYDSTSSDASSGPLIVVMTLIPMMGALGSVILLAGLRLTYRDHQAVTRAA